ncbi:MAG: hypothetical protein K2J20_03360, partial [Bacilli bacterium]|nr:hypothetical protein [Bacilli bacterium]
NPTILEMGYVDSGVYTMSGILPNTYYFEKLNIAYENFPDNVDSMQKYIKEGQVQFVVYFTKLNEKRLRPREKVLFENYTLLKHENVMYDGKKMHAYLFKLNS